MRSLDQAHVRLDECPRRVPVRSVQEDGEAVSESPVSDSLPVSLSALDDDDSDCELSSLSLLLLSSSSSSGCVMSNTDDLLVKAAHPHKGGIDHTKQRRRYE